MSVTLPDGNSGNLESVLYGGQDSGAQIEVCIVPLCAPCLRDKPAEYLLDKLEKTQSWTSSQTCTSLRRDVFAWRGRPKAKSLPCLVPALPLAIGSLYSFASASSPG